MALLAGCLLLLLVFGGMLAAILFPVFQRAREASRRASCIQNMRGVYLACQAYACDNEDRFPPALADVEQSLSEGVTLKCPSSGKPYDYSPPAGKVSELQNPRATVVLRCSEHDVVVSADGGVGRK